MTVNYILNGGEKSNMVLLVPHDIPESGATTSNLQRLGPKVLFLAIPFLPHYTNPLKGIGKLFALRESVYRWKLCIREELSN